MDSIYIEYTGIPHMFFMTPRIYFLEKYWVSVPEYLNISNVLILTKFSLAYFQLKVVPTVIFVRKLCR